jgi:hypothetical protein
MGNLRAVAVDERKKAKPTSILDAGRGDEMTLLVALRDNLAREIDKGVPAHALRGIVSEIRDLDRSIRALEVRQDGDDLTDATRTDDAAFDAAAL